MVPAMTSPPLDIRLVRYDNPTAAAMIESLQDYYHGLYRGPDRSPVDPEDFAPPAGLFFVGYSEDVAVAAGGWRWLEPPHDMTARKPVEVKRMYVAPRARGNGYARAMLSHLESSAQHAGADWVILSTGAPQGAAIALYRSAGYGDVPKFGYYARYDSAVHLGKRLGSIERASGATAIAPPPDGTAH